MVVNRWIKVEGSGIGGGKLLGFDLLDLGFCKLNKDQLRSKRYRWESMTSARDEQY